MNHIKNLNTQYNNLYATLTKFGKVMAKNFDNENLENFKLYKYDKNLFFQVIINYISYIKYFNKRLLQKICIEEVILKQEIL